jgi:hypothetical protein
VEYRKTLKCGDVEQSHREISQGSLFPECVAKDELITSSIQPVEQVRVAQRLDKIIEIAG